MKEEINTYKTSLKIPYKKESVIKGIQSQEFPDLSIIIPAFNEEKTIGSVVTTIKKIMLSFGIFHEIIVINDGSTDRTKEEAEKLDIIVINLRENSGKGSALKSGFEASKGRFLLTVDADGSHQKDGIKQVIKEFFEKEVHMLIGSRFLNEVKVSFTSPINIVGNKIFKYLLLFISGKYLTDSQSGLRIFNRSVLNSINCKSEGYEIESEITAKTLGLGFKVKEVPIICKPRFFGSSHLNSLRDGLKITKTIVFSYFRGRKHLKKNIASIPTKLA